MSFSNMFKFKYVLGKMEKEVVIVNWPSEKSLITIAIIFWSERVALICLEMSRKRDG